MLRPLAAGAVAAMLTVFSSPVFAQNLLPNADFDTNLDGWDTTVGTDWSPQDSDGSPSSGSLAIVVTEPKSTAITTCVPVTAGDTYEFGADIKIDLEGSAEGRAVIVVRWEADAACSQSLNDLLESTFLTSAPDWTTHHVTAAAPQGAVAALVELRTTKTGPAGGSITASFDDAVFQSLAIAGCADPVAPFGKVTAGDALFVLRASVGSTECDVCYCNVNGTGGTTATDALIALKAAVSLPVSLACPACG
ncbi:MAG TPA: hypothetical protein VN634_15875 [Candidatus Limnocylindrales bacterium]|nr:hypothetical protein [Candidatus Limnocylindrales bacterium]